jgi:anti-anti-sigma factor
MTFSVSLSTRGQTAVITLKGDLDEASAAQFRDKVVSAADGGVSKLVLDMSDLDSLSSAGLRALAFTREKMADDVAIVIVSPTESVRETIDGVGFQQSVTFSDSVPE